MANVLISSYKEPAMSEEKKIYKVDAVIRPEKLEELKDNLYEIYRGSVLYVNLLPKIKVEIVIYETPLDTLIDTIRGVCNTGHVGDGKIFVSELYTAVKIRTGERGGAAIIDDKA